MTRRHGVTHFSPDGCFGCRMLTVQFPAPSGPAFQPHFNYATGQYVTSDREFRDQLKQLSEDQSARTGIDASYEPRYPGDIHTTDEGVQDRAKLLHDTSSG